MHLCTYTNMYVFAYMHYKNSVSFKGQVNRPRQSAVHFHFEQIKKGALLSTLETQARFNYLRLFLRDGFCL